MARVAARARWELRSEAGRFPSIYLPAIRWRSRAGQFQIPLADDTELVIDGFLRSGTTFVFTAFEHAQPRKVRVAHHVHAPAQIMAAVQRGIPVLLLIRDPREAVLSLVVRLPHLSLAQGLRAYARFYEPLSPYRNGVVVGAFERAVGDVGGLTGEVNARFGTNFAAFEHTKDGLAAVRALIDEGDRREFGEGDAFERAVGRPSPVRDRLKDQLRTAYASPSLARLRRRADRAYARITSGSDPTPDPRLPPRDRR
jgi:hypothetical protein